MVSNLKKSIVRKALPKPNILQLSEYNITQKIMESLVNACHRSVLFSIVDNAKDAPKISNELNISLSAVYKTLSKLEELTLVEIDRFDFVDGKKTKLYRSRIGHAEITLENNDATLHLFPNKSNKEEKI
jgi:predicted transcriptional regulator|tara:strand:- start:259 stop:645 length:387 start_codon:yes stop_codon:yes gene_type:complete